MNGLIQHLATSGIDLSEDNILRVSLAYSIYYYYDDIVRWDLPDEFYLIIFASLWSPVDDTIDNKAYLIQYYHLGNGLKLLKEIDHDSRGTHVICQKDTSRDNLQYFLDTTQDQYPITACGIYLKSI